MQASDEISGEQPTANAALKSDHLSDVSFAALNLHPKLQSALNRMGYTHCTPIQARTLPLALTGDDLAGQAQTGTGKTAAFLLATFHHLLTSERKGPADAPRALVLAPTRELALQIYNDAQAIGADAGISTAVVYGGTGYDSQRKRLEEGVDLLIGTPGRMIDYFKQKVFTLKHIEVFVLDEADRMFDLGFIADIRYVLRRMPPPHARRNYLFSATLSHRVLELAYEHMNSPKRIEIAPEQVTAERVNQSLIHVSNDDKLPLLVGLLRKHEPTRTMIFVNTKRSAEIVESTLTANGFKAQTLSGDVPQNKRERLLNQFRTGELAIMVATDVAARGLHIPDVSHVINYDLPQDAEDYVHRIGRTARAGEAGDAISLCCETYVYSLPDIERLIGERIPVLAHSDELMASDFKRGKRPPRKPSAGRSSQGRRPHHRSGPRR